MKMVVLFIVSVFVMETKLDAQDYMINFDCTGATNIVGVVKVKNLTSRDSLTIGGQDTLRLLLLVGIDKKDINNENLQIYPNPMSERSILTIVSTENSEAIIDIVDLSGNIASQKNVSLTSGANSFGISGIQRGLYIVKVSTNRHSYSTKLLSQNGLPGKPSIDYISSVEKAKDKQLKLSSTIINMFYTPGDQLLFQGSSGIFSTIVPDVPTSSKTITFFFVACTDSNNNNYTIVEIGNQTWMAENLNVGIRIDGSQVQSNNGITEKYCYGNFDSKCAVFGGLYLWDEVMQYDTVEGTKGICPIGWHVPTDGEWATLTNFLGGQNVAGGKLKETGEFIYGTGHWFQPNYGATNSSGFTALPSGTRYYNGLFYDINSGNDFWSSTQHGANNAWDWYQYYATPAEYRYDIYKDRGASCRCLKD